MVIGRSRPSGTGKTKVSKSVQGTLYLDSIQVCNTDSSIREYSIYLADTGQDFSKSNAIYYKNLIDAHSSDSLWLSPGGIELTGKSKLGVRVDSGSSVTFTFIGREGPS